jgi:hypothetical protein
LLGGRGVVVGVIDEEREGLNSLLYWFPRIRPLVPTPKTVWVEVDDGILWDLENPLPMDVADALKLKANEIGYPLFMRTANVSGKFEWKDTCYVASEDRLLSNIHHLVEFNLCLMPTPNMEAIVFREFLEMDTKFTAFSGNMPINRERRYFINHGKVVCHHGYWPLDAIVNPSVPGWEGLLVELNAELPGEVGLLSEYAERVGKVLDGFWSVDFCRQKNGEWVLTDMAVGERSYHDHSCPFCGTDDVSMISGDTIFKAPYDWKK